MNTEQYGRYTVREAAIRLEISEAAVHQRIRRHTLLAERSDEIVYVVLADDSPSETVDVTPDSTAIIRSTEHQLEVISDTLLRPLIAQNERQQCRIAELEREAGSLSTERDALRSRVSDLETQQAESYSRADEHDGDAATARLVAVLRPFIVVYFRAIVY